MAGGSVRGQVLRADTGAAVAQAAIVVLESPASYPDIAIMTDQDGRFRIADAAAGQWRLGATGPNGETGQASIAVADGAVAETVIRVR